MTKQNKLLLNYLLKQYKQNLRENDSFSLQKQIQTYFSMTLQVSRKRKEIQDKIKQIQDMDKSLKNRFSKIQSYMDQHKIYQKKVNSWVARLRTVAKYKRVQPDYKQMWAEALKKVNDATRKVLQGISDANIQMKKSATKIQLQLVQQSVMDIIKSIFSKFSKLFQSFSIYNKLANTLPTLEIKQNHNRKVIKQSLFLAFYNSKKIEIQAKDLWDAKQKAILQLKVPKSKLGLLAVVSAKSQEDQDFRFS